ncbi:unnamed protein product [Effrenium voratum]|nr:unnamed protein product [Effrenium voratum]
MLAVAQPCEEGGEVINLLPDLLLYESELMMVGVEPPALCAEREERDQTFRENAVRTFFCGRRSVNSVLAETFGPGGMVSSLRKGKKGVYRDKKQLPWGWWVAQSLALHEYTLKGKDTDFNPYGKLKDTCRAAQQGPASTGAAMRQMYERHFGTRMPDLKDSSPDVGELVVDQIKPKLQKLAEKNLPGPLVGLAHGDLNAANIMIDALDAVWLIDFATSVELPFEMACLFEYAIVPITAENLYDLAGPDEEQLPSDHWEKMGIGDWLGVPQEVATSFVRQLQKVKKDKSSTQRFGRLANMEQSQLEAMADEAITQLPAHKQPQAEPFIPIRLVAGEGASQVARKAGVAGGAAFSRADAAGGPFVLELSKASALKSAVPPLAEALGLGPQGPRAAAGVTFMQEGRTLELDKYQVIQEMEKKARKAEEEVAMAEQQRLKEQKLKELKERKVLEEAEQEKQRKSKVVTAEANLHQQIEQHVGVNRERYQELLANPDPDVVKPRHYLEPATSEQEAAVKGLLEAAGAAKDIACAYWVHHEELRMRYERAKAGLQADSSRILKKESTTTNHVLNRKDLAFLGDFDRSVNEFCLWHGTGRLEGAAGICANGFDIAYVGSAVGTAWGHGFYFADSAATSMSYTGAGIRGGDACNGSPGLQ